MKKLWDKKNSKKGFTLVELIVVLVILGILAAISIPSMIGWIDKAKEKEVVLEARNAYLATQTIIFENHAKTGTTAEGDIDDMPANWGAEFEDISKLDVDNVTALSYNDKGVITDFTYTKDTITAIYTDDDGWTISD